MKNIDITIPAEIINPPAGTTHVATSWEKAIYSDFQLDEYIVRRSLNDTINLSQMVTQLDSSILKSNKIYYRFKLHFSDGSQTNWSDSQVYTVEDPEYVEPVVVGTPDVAIKPQFAEDGSGELKLESSEFVIHLGEAEHESTSWKIEDDQKNVVYDNPRDTVNLKDIAVPITLLEDDKLYTVKSTYHDAAGVDSAVGVSTFNSFIVNDEYFTLQESSGPTLGRELYFTLGLKTTMFASIDIEIRDDETNSLLAANLEQTSLTPHILVPETLDPAKTYNIIGRLRLTNGDITPFTTVLNTIVRENEMVAIDTNINYLAQFDFMENYDLGGLIVESSRELYDGSILIANSKTGDIDRYEMEDLKLVKKGVAIEIPDIDHIGNPYIGIIPMFNGDVVINYGGNSSGLKDQKSIWRRYSFNSVTKEFSEIATPLVIEDEWLSVGIANSYHVTKDDRIIYVPAREVDNEENDTALNLRVIDYDKGTTVLSSSLLEALPFTALRNVSLAGRIEGGKDYIYIFGGSAEILTGVRIAQWPRSNNNVYKYDVDAGTFSSVVTMSDSDVSDDIETMHVFLRRDDKFVIFNANRLGGTTNVQDTIVFNPADNSFTNEGNDVVDELPYRSSIALLNGDVLRISGRVVKQQVVNRYVSDTLTADQLDEQTEFIKPINELTVPAGETVNIEDLYVFTKVTIEGTDNDDTGILQWQDGDEVRTFQWDDLIVPADTTMTKAEYEAVAWRSVTVLEDAQLIVESV